MKTCTKCLISKPLDCFAANKKSAQGRTNECKVCKSKRQQLARSTPEGKQYALNASKKCFQNKMQNLNTHKKLRITMNRANNAWKKRNPDIVTANIALRRAAKLQATPPWFEKELIDVVYAKAKQWGFEVDHVIPLKGKNVCGLHCWANLQLLNKSLNASKGNRL